MVWSRVKGLDTGERSGHKRTVWSRVNGFGQRCRVWSGGNCTITDELIDHG